jgi:very-short-patch-repair endonuclease
MMPKNIIKGQAISREKLALAKEFRHTSTAAEKILWQSLRTEGLGGWHFRRQQILFGYIVDFYCHAASLIIEVDGEIHDHQQAADQKRGSILQEKGFQILRFRNLEIENNLNAVLSKILEACNQSLPIIPSPLPLQGYSPRSVAERERGRGRGPKGTQP